MTDSYIDWGRSGRNPTKFGIFETELYNKMVFAEHNLVKKLTSDEDVDMR